MNAVTEAKRDAIMREHGWSPTRSGRWFHPGRPGSQGRRRLFTADVAWSLVSAEVSRREQEEADMVELDRAIDVMVERTISEVLGAA